MKECNCKDWKKNVGVLDGALGLYSNHGFGGIDKPFNYCPYCGKELSQTSGGKN